MLKTVLADEGVNSRIVAALRTSGVDVQWIAEISPGMKAEEIVNAYPDLEIEDIEQSLHFAAALAKGQQIEFTFSA